MNIYVDIETIPCQNPTIAQQLIEGVKPDSRLKDESKIAADIEKKQAEVVGKTSLNGTFGEIVSIACAIDNEPPVVFYREDWQTEDRERLILTEFFNYINQNYHPNTDMPPIFIGHNHIDFDLRFIFQRAVVNKIKPFAFFPIHAKAWDRQVYDTMQEWAGTRNYISMNDLCLALGIDGKSDEIDGSKVWDYVQQGKIAEVADYNKADVERTRAIYKRMVFLE